MRSTSSITCCARTSLLETLAWPKSGIVGFFVHQVSLRLGPPLPALPTHYVKIEVNEIFGLFVLASRQALLVRHRSTQVTHLLGGYMYVRRVDLQTDRQTDRQADRYKQRQADRV